MKAKSPPPPRAPRPPRRSVRPQKATGRKLKITKCKKSRKPLGEKEICRIVGLRVRHPEVPARKIGDIYHETFGSLLAEPTIKRILLSCGLPETVSRSASFTGGICRYGEVTAANDVWTVDFRSGWRNRSGLPEPIIVRDEFTRFVIAARVLPDSSAPTMRAFFDEIFGSNGFPKAICCPQATPFASGRSLLGLTNISARWLAMGIHLEWKQPGHLRECRWSERPLVQFGYAWRFQNFDERQQELDRWREDFNNTAHPGQKNPPASSFSPPRSASSSGPLPAVQLDYPGLERRRISKTGHLRFRGSECFLSSALAGWDIALAPKNDGHFDVRFAQVSLGTLDPEKIQFTPTILC